MTRAGLNVRAPSVDLLNSRESPWAQTTVMTGRPSGPVATASDGGSVFAPPCRTRNARHRCGEAPPSVTSSPDVDPSTPAARWVNFGGAQTGAAREGRADVVALGVSRRQRERPVVMPGAAAVSGEEGARDSDEAARPRELCRAQQAARVMGVHGQRGFRMSSETVTGGQPRSPLTRQLSGRWGAYRRTRGANPAGTGPPGRGAEHDDQREHFKPGHGGHPLPAGNAGSI